MPESAATAERRRNAVRLVVLLGLVSLFADMCYEGMRSAVGPYLALLGASATAVGFVAGLGELLGYGLRYLTGRFVDRTGRYWAITIAGYSVNLIAVPLLALAGSWPAVAVLVALERTGKAIRSPARAAITSFAARDVGAGRAFAIHEAMDQVGGMLGPLAVFGVLAWKGETATGFAWAFALLAIPAALSLVTLLVARRRYPDPRALDAAAADAPAAELGGGFTRYLIGVALIAFGLSDWPLLAFHLQRTHAVATTVLPVVYAAAMLADGIAALAVGRWFDRARARGRSGAGVLAACILAGAAFAPLVLLGDAVARWLPLVGVAVWAFTLAATESIAKSTVAVLVPPGARGRAYGIYYLVFGAAWWVGSLVTGVLYDQARWAAAAFASSALVAAAIVLAGIARR